MASQAYYTWDAAGRPWKPARPIAELQAWAQANGVTVLGTIGNEEHLQHVPPQVASGSGPKPPIFQSMLGIGAPPTEPTR